MNKILTKTDITHPIEKHRLEKYSENEILPKIFLACNKIDFDELFEMYMNDILSVAKCEILNIKKEKVDNITIENDIYNAMMATINLVVFIVTDTFLKEPDLSYERDFSYVTSHHMPIIIIKHNHFFENIYQEKIGSLHYISKYLDSSTNGDFGQVRPLSLTERNSYKKELEQNLNHYLFDDELKNEIFKEFKGKIFLSYRKKDYISAHSLMRSIHSNRNLRDISIWIDDFLISGENYDNSIKENLIDSDIVVVNVTPNIIKKPNYVLDVEYPAALSFNKPVLCIETEKTDYTHFYENFKEANFIYLNEEINLSNLFQHNNDTNSKEHLYLIGMAYMNGIGVELDQNIGEEMLTESAEKGCLLAVKELIDYYRRKRNHEKLLEYSKKQDILTKANNSNLSSETLKSEYELANAYKSMNENNIALEMYLQIYSKYKGREESKNVYYLYNLDKLANEYVSRGDLKNNIEDLKKALDYYIELIELEDSVYSGSTFIPSYSNQSMLFAKLGYYKESLTKQEYCYNHALNIKGETDDTTLFYLHRIARIHSIFKQYEKALEPFDRYYRAKKEKYGALDETVIGALRNLADTYYYLQDYDRAYSLYRVSHQRLQDLPGEHQKEMAEILRNVNLSLKMRDITKGRNNNDKPAVDFFNIYTKKNDDNDDVSFCCDCVKASKIGEFSEWGLMIYENENEIITARENGGLVWADKFYVMNFSSKKYGINLKEDYNYTYRFYVLFDYIIYESKIAFYPNDNLNNASIYDDMEIDILEPTPKINIKEMTKEKIKNFLSKI